MEDGNTLFRTGRLDDASYRYEYALKRLPRLKEATPENDEHEDVFIQLKSHLLLNLSRTQRKQKKYEEAIRSATQVLDFKPDAFEAFWARGKAKKDTGSLEDALADLREAITLAPQNMELHRFTLKVKEELESRNATTLSPTKQVEEVEDVEEIDCLV